MREFLKHALSASLCTSVVFLKSYCVLIQSNNALGLFNYSIPLIKMLLPDFKYFNCLSAYF